MRARYGKDAPRLVVAEPDRAACLMASCEAGQLTAVDGPLDTVMAGLACGEPSLLAWQELERAAFGFVSIPDEAAVACMKALHKRQPRIVAGESAVAGLAALLLRGGTPSGGRRWSFGGSRVLLLGTEGATDPELHAKLVAGDAG
jgi:diaminopropionate ammonia-lyase